MKYLAILLFSLLFCFGMQVVSLKAVGGRTIKSESNFFSSLGRIQAGAQDDTQVMVLGSSITGRLPDWAQGFKGVANLGCDGGSAADMIRAIHDGRLPSAPVLFIEANAMQIALKGEGEVAAAMRRPWFKVGRKFPVLSAYARPSAFAYSLLLASRTGTYGTHDGPQFEINAGPTHAEPKWHNHDGSHAEIALADELAARILDIRQAGSRVIVVWMPPRRPNGHAPADWILRLVARSGAEWWDLAQQLQADDYRLTDSVHMDANSATKTMRTLLSALNSSKP